MDNSHPAGYRDSQLAGHMKELRACCKPFPRAKAALERTENRLRYLLRLLQTWDETHERQVETWLRLGNIEAANTSAALIFDPETRLRLLRRAQITPDTEDAADRWAENELMERMVIE